MKIDIKIPDIGDADSIELLKWIKKPGDTFLKGDELCELVTDKATFSLEAPQNGELLEVHLEAGSKVQIGELAATISISE